MLTFQSVLGIPVRWERLFASQDAQKPVFYYNGICLQSQVFCNKTNPILLHVQQKTAMHNCTAALYFRKIRETLHKARLTALHAICLQIFRHIAEKSDYASYAQALFSVSLGITFCPARSPKSDSCLHPAGQRSKGYSTRRWNLPSRHRQYRQRRSGQR